MMNISLWHRWSSLVTLFLFRLNTLRYRSHKTFEGRFSGYGGSGGPHASNLEESPDVPQRMLDFDQDNLAGSANLCIH
jgi:hypothetical protein